MEVNSSIVGWQTPVYHLFDKVYLKMENLNLGGSHKTRSAKWMIDTLVKSGALTGKSNQVLIEKTGGNLGIGLAIEANKRGIPLELAVGLKFSSHKKALLESYGATLIGKDMLNNGAQPKDVIQFHLEHQISLGKEYIFLDQFKNEANLHAHLFETGPEILDFISSNNLTDRKIYLVGGVGSGASLGGIGLTLKKSCKNVKVYAVQPKGCDIENGVFVDHDLQGIAVGVKPAIYRSDIVDSYINCSESDAMEAKDWLLKKHGIFCGKSSGANVYAVRKLVSELKLMNTYEEAVIFTLIYDSGDSYI